MKYSLQNLENIENSIEKLLQIYYKYLNDTVSILCISF